MYIEIEHKDGIWNTCMVNAFCCKIFCLSVPIGKTKCVGTGGSTDMGGEGVGGGTKRVPP